LYSHFRDRMAVFVLGGVHRSTKPLCPMMLLKQFRIRPLSCKLLIPVSWRREDWKVWTCRAIRSAGAASDEMTPEGGDGFFALAARGAAPGYPGARRRAQANLWA